MSHNIYVYILLMGMTTLLIRLLPLTLIRSEIKQPFLRSFLHYVPYVTLAVMTVPGIFYATQTWVSGVAAFIVASCFAFFTDSIFYVAAVACATVYIAELFLL